MAKTTLEKWITTALDDPDKDGKLRLMSLIHIRGTNAEVEIHSVKFVDGTNYNPTTLANMFHGKAETDCENLVGMQQYFIYAFYGEKNQWEARFPLMMSGEGDAKYNGFTTESPDAKGITQQAMRLTEGIVKGTFSTMGNMQHYQQQYMHEISAENRELRKENRDVLLIMKDILLEQTKLSHEQRLKEMEVAGNLEMKKTMLKAMPVLVNQLGGKEIFPQSTEDTALIEMLADNVDPDQLKMLLPALKISPAAQGALMSRLTRYLQEKREGEKRIKELVGGNTSAELDFPKVHDGEEEAAE